MTYGIALLTFSPLLLPFAPVPIIKPMTDPDKAIEQFDQLVRSADDATIAERKKRLLSRMRDLYDTLTKRGELSEAEAVHDRLILIESIEANRALGSDVTSRELLRRASGDGKYRGLLHVLYVPNDRNNYSDFVDYGHWPGSSYGSYTDLKHGHWVYAHPRWFVWRDGPPRQ